MRAHPSKYTVKFSKPAQLLIVFASSIGCFDYKRDGYFSAVAEK